MSKFTIEILQMSKNPLWTSVLVEANSYSEAIFDSLHGPRVFYLKKGSRLRLRIKNSYARNWMVGDCIKRSGLVSSAIALENIPWCWA